MFINPYMNAQKNPIKNNVIIGIYGKSLTKRGEYRALTGLELLEQNRTLITM